MSLTIRELIKTYSLQLAAISSTPHLDIELLLSNILKKNRSFIYTYPEDKLTAIEIKRFKTLFAKRRKGVPLAYILGSKEFWGLQLKVTPKVLIPRAETELLVEVAVAKLPKNQLLKIADFGTGSGALALAIAKERPLSKVIGIEQSSEALKIARYNARQLKLHNVKFKRGDWKNKLNISKLDMIVSNPPYVASNDPKLKTAPLKFEPRGALSSGPDGLNALRLIIKCARTKLRGGGLLILEHGASQGAKVRKLLASYGYKNVTTYSDLAHLDRVTLGQM